MSCDTCNSIRYCISRIKPAVMIETDIFFYH